MPEVHQLHLFPQSELMRLREVVEDVEQALGEQTGEVSDKPLSEQVRELSRKLRDWQDESEQEAAAFAGDQERLLKALDVETVEAGLMRVHWLEDLRKIASSCVDTSAKSAELIIRLRTHLATAPPK